MEHAPSFRAAFLILTLVLSVFSCESGSDLNDPFAAQDEFLAARAYIPKPSIFCLLNPDSSRQHLTIEFVSPDWDYLYFGQMGRKQDIALSMGADSTLFVRSLTDPAADSVGLQRIESPLWDHYSVSDSSMDIVHGGVYSLSGVLRTSITYGPTATDTTILVTDPMPPEIDIRGLIDKKYNLRFIIPYQGSTTVPGPFEISSPPDGAEVLWQDELTVKWMESPGCYGYMVLIFTKSDDPLAVEQNGSVLRYRAVTYGTSHTLPYGLKSQYEKPFFERYGQNEYIIEVWAVDKNAFDFFKIDPSDRLLEPPSGIELAAGLFGSIVIRRINLTITDED